MAYVSRWVAFDFIEEGAQGSRESLTVTLKVVAQPIWKRQYPLADRQGRRADRDWRNASESETIALKPKHTGRRKGLGQVA
jgi:hypothetical protein